MSHTITIALEPYDRHFPLVEREWTTSSGTALEFVLVGQLADQVHGRNRHERFLRDREFDVAEMSLSSYLMYRERHRDLVALPVFPRRMFSFSNVWVRADADASCWPDLRSGVIGIPTFQMSLGVVARRDMEEVEGVKWTDFTWVTSHDEALSFAAPTVALQSESLAAALHGGEVDALLVPEIPGGQSFVRAARRLYGSRAKEIEQGLLRDQGYAPIVHLVVAQADVLERHPGLGRDLVQIFSEAYDIAWKRYDDPAWALTFWGRHELEQQRAARGQECWSHGLEPNRRALQDFCDAAAEQGIVQRVPDMSDLFPSTTNAEWNS